MTRIKLQLDGITESYLFHDPSDWTVSPSVYFTIETYGVSLTEWTIWSDGPTKLPVIRMNPGWPISLADLGGHPGACLPRDQFFHFCIHFW